MVAQTRPGGQHEYMKKIILDTSIVLKWPDILARRKKDAQFVIVPSCFQELTELLDMHKGVPTIFDLINDSLRSGNTVEYQNIARLDDRRSRGLSPNDCDLVMSALELQGQGFEVYVAADDSQLLQEAQRHSIKVKTLKDLQKEFPPNADTIQAINEKAKEFTAIQRRYLIAGTVIGVGISILVAIAWLNLQAILNTIRIWGLIVALVVLALLLYRLRNKNRFAYGITEYLTGLCLGIMLFYPNFDYENVTWRSFLQILASVYIMVRGLDNIGKALQKTRYATILKSWLRNHRG